MSRLKFIAMSTELAEAFRAGRADDNGRPPERIRSDGSGLPCRHCLADIAADEPALLLAWRPFDTTQPYAETGPVFLHAEHCRRHADTAGDLPPILLSRARVLVRGYDTRQRIVDGSGGMLETAGLVAHCESLLADPRVDFVHLRSATNGCYQCRVERDAAR